jgi:hypothetical protein
LIPYTCRSRYRLLRYAFFEQSVLEAGVPQLRVIAGGSFNVLSVVIQLRSSDSRLARIRSIEDAANTSTVGSRIGRYALKRRPRDWAQ